MPWPRSPPRRTDYSSCGTHPCGEGRRGHAGGHVDRQEVELLAIGAGPANLALGVAIEELASEELSDRALIVEQHDDIVWQRGMLLPWTLSQVSFLKDLVTRRNPRSRYSFVNYLHSIGRLDAFINLGSFLPYRTEIS